MAEIQQELESMEIENESGGGMVKVIVNGKKQIISIDINPEILNEDKDMVGDLILVAINQALDKVDSI